MNFGNGILERADETPRTTILILFHLSLATEEPILNRLSRRSLHYAAQKRCSRLDSNQRLCITSIRLAPAGHKRIQNRPLGSIYVYSVFATRPLERALIGE
jgi:hypothetical protein